MKKEEKEAQLKSNLIERLRSYLGKDKTDEIAASDNSVDCSECGGSFIENNEHRIVCSCCGIEVGESTSLYDGSPLRSKFGYVYQNQPGTNYKGSNLYQTDAKKNKYLYRRLEKHQTKNNQVNNLDKVRSAEKRDKVIKLGELAFRKIKLPQEIKKEVFKLFIQTAEKLKFPHNKAHLYAAACAWYYTDINCVSNINIHSITRDLDSKFKNTEVLQGAARLLHGKLNMLKQSIRNGQLYRKTGLLVECLKQIESYEKGEESEYITNLTNKIIAARTFTKKITKSQILNQEKEKCTNLLMSLTGLDIEGINNLLNIESIEVNRIIIKNILLDLITNPIYSINRREFNKEIIGTINELIPFDPHFKTTRAYITDISMKAKKDGEWKEYKDNLCVQGKLLSEYKVGDRIQFNKSNNLYLEVSITKDGQIPGADILKEIIDNLDLSDEQITENLSDCMDLINSVCKRSSSRLNRKISSYRKEVQDLYINSLNEVKYILKEAEKSGKDLSQNQSEIILKNINFISQCHRNISNKWDKHIPSHDEICGWNLRDEDPTIEQHIRKHINLLINKKIIATVQAKMLNNTALIFSRNITAKSTAGKSRHAVAAAIIWLSLMYHGVRINLSDYAPQVNVSKSTISFRASEIEKDLGFERDKRIIEFGYLRPQHSKTGNPFWFSYLFKIGESQKFVDSHDGLVEEAENTLLYICTSAERAKEFSIARLLFLKILLTGGDMAEEAIKAKLKQLINCEKNRLQYILYHTTAFFKKESVAHLVKFEDGNFFVSERLKEYVIDCFGKFDMAISRCGIGLFRRDRCNVAIETVKKILCVDEEQLQSVKEQFKGGYTPNNAGAMIDVSGDTMKSLIIDMKVNQNKTYKEIIEAIKEKFNKKKSRGFVYKYLKDAGCVKLNKKKE